MHLTYHTTALFINSIKISITILMSKDHSYGNFTKSIVDSTRFNSELVQGTVRFYRNFLTIIIIIISSSSSSTIINIIIIILFIILLLLDGLPGFARIPR